MAPRSWAAHFGRDKVESPPKPAPAPAAGGLSALFEFLRQWQIGVAVIAGSVGLLFSVTDFQQKKLAINQKALEFVRGEREVKRFWADPQNMVNEIEASFPRHAFCSALGFYLAETARADLRLTRGETVASDGPTVDSVNRAREALDEEVARIGAEAGADVDDLREQAQGAGRAEQSCARIQAGAGLLGRQWVARECLLVLDAYGENLCLTEREPLRIARAAASRQTVLAMAPDHASAAPGAVATAPAGPDLALAPAPAPAAPLPSAPQSAPAAPDPCATLGPLLVFVQYTDTKDLDEVVAAMERMQRPAWRLVGPDLVATAKGQGDVRYYSANQQACAESLAQVAGAELGGKPLPTLSLQGRYTNLRAGRMELWLPDFK